MFWRKAYGLSQSEINGKRNRKGKRKSNGT